MTTTGVVAESFFVVRMFATDFMLIMYLGDQTCSDEAFVDSLPRSACARVIILFSKGAGVTDEPRDTRSYETNRPMIFVCPPAPDRFPATACGGCMWQAGRQASNRSGNATHLRSAWGRLATGGGRGCHGTSLLVP